VVRVSLESLALLTYDRPDHLEIVSECKILMLRKAGDAPGELDSVWGRRMKSRGLGGSSLSEVL
jgi:hypothetical protein